MAEMIDCICCKAAIDELYKLPCKIDEDGYRWVLSRDVAHMIDSIPDADVVARDCYDRILAENDMMREQLAQIGKKPGDTMDDVRPVVHGEWRNAHPSSPLLDGGGPPYCSVCGKEAPLRSVEVNQWKLERGSLSGPKVVYKTKCFLSNFCPNCGADMREPNLDTTKGDNHD